MIQNLIYDDLGKLVIELLNKKFEKVSGISYAEFRTNERINHSNFPRALAINQILLEEIRINKRVLNLQEVLENWDNLPEQSSNSINYAHTNSIVVYPNEGIYEHIRKNEHLRIRALQVVGREKTDIPLIISNLGIRKEDNHLGFTFEETDFLETIEAPFLNKKRTNLSYDSKNIVSSEEGIETWAQEHQSGICGICWKLGRIYAFQTEIFESFDTGRIQIIDI